MSKSRINGTRDSRMLINAKSWNVFSKKNKKSNQPCVEFHGVDDQNSTLLKTLLQPINSPPTMTLVSQKRVNRVLEEYKDVFKDPTGLPLHC